MSAKGASRTHVHPASSSDPRPLYRQQFPSRRCFATTTASTTWLLGSQEVAPAWNINKLAWCQYAKSLAGAFSLHAGRRGSRPATARFKIAARKGVEPMTPQAQPPLRHPRVLATMRT